MNSASEASASVEKISGLYITSRTASNIQKLYVNNVIKINGVAITTKIPNQDMTLLALLNGGSVYNYFENDQISFAFIGAGLTSTEARQVTNCIEYYMDALGKGVIP